MAEIAINEDNQVTRGGYLIGKERLVLSMLQKKNEARKKHARQLIAFWACLLLLGIRGKETRIALDRYLMFEPSRAIHGHLSWGEEIVLQASLSHLVLAQASHWLVFSLLFCSAVANLQKMENGSRTSIKRAYEREFSPCLW